MVGKGSQTALESDENSTGGTAASNKSLPHAQCNILALSTIYPGELVAWNALYAVYSSFNSYPNSKAFAMNRGFSCASVCVSRNASRLFTSRQPRISTTHCFAKSTILRYSSAIQIQL